MKIRTIGGLVAFAAIPLCFNACKDEEPKPAGISFETAVEEITESDGTIKSFHPAIWEEYSGETGATGREHLVKLKLDKKLSETAVISYTLGGTASRNSAAVEGDYDIEGSNITIEKGATEVAIPITIYEDLDFELDEATDSLFETIELTLTSVVSGPIKLGDQVNYKLKINEDDAVWFLQWGTGGTDSPGDVDMDILFTYDNQIVWGAASSNRPEGVAVPGGFPSGEYGLSYTYYQGTSDDVDFAVFMFSTSGTLNGQKYVFPVDDPLTFTGHYTASNVNKWDENPNPPMIVQTVTKNGLNYTNITDINEPTSGSRVKVSTPKLDKELLSRIRTFQNNRPVKR